MRLHSFYYIIINIYILPLSTLKRYIANYKPYVPQTSELLKVIELDIRIDNICLKDRFEWDINDPKNNPEVFYHHKFIMY